MYLFVCFFKARKILTKNVGNVSVVNFVLFYFIFFLGLENSKCFFIKKNVFNKIISKKLGRFL